MSFTFSAADINKKRLGLNRRKNELGFYLTFALFFWLAPLTRPLPPWFDVFCRVLASANALILIRETDEVSREEQVLLAEIDVSRKLLQKQIGVLQYQHEQAILAPVIPPPPQFNDAVEVEARQLPPAQQEPGQAIAPTAQQWDDDPEVAPSKPVEQPKQDAVDSRLFELIYTNHKRHLLLPAETGAGKTTILLGTIDYINTATNGNAEFFGSTAKVSPWLGLENEIADDGLPKIINLSFDRPETILDLIERLKWLVRRGEGRQQRRTECEQQGKEYKPKPIYIMLDEWIRTCAIAQKYDRLKKASTFNELIELVEHFLLVGREDEMIVWLFGQDHQVQNNHINTGFRKSFGIVVPGIWGNMMGIEDALLGKSPLVTPDRKKPLFAEAEQLAQQNPSIPIAYCNIDGHNIIALPYLPDIKRKRIFGNGETVKRSQSQQSTTVEVVAQPVDPKAYRYPANWPEIRNFTQQLTGRQCCFPGCPNPSTSVHHARYMVNGMSICNAPRPGEDIFPLCDTHHKDKQNPECAHHPNNWIYGQIQEPLEIDSRNDPRYHQLLREGFLQKTAQQMVAA